MLVEDDDVVVEPHAGARDLEAHRSHRLPTFVDLPRDVLCRIAQIGQVPPDRIRLGVIAKAPGHGASRRNRLVEVRARTLNEGDVALANLLEELMDSLRDIDLGVEWKSNIPTGAEIVAALSTD
jgi:hypothetical protein